MTGTRSMTCWAAFVDRTAMPRRNRLGVVPSSAVNPKFHRGETVLFGDRLRPEIERLGNPSC